VWVDILVRKSEKVILLCGDCSGVDYVRDFHGVRTITKATFGFSQKRTGRQRHSQPKDKAISEGNPNQHLSRTLGRLTLIMETVRKFNHR